MLAAFPEALMTFRVANTVWDISMILSHRLSLAGQFPFNPGQLCARQEPALICDGGFPGGGKMWRFVVRAGWWNGKS